MRNIGLRTAAQAGDAAAYRSEAAAIKTLERKGFVDTFTVDGDMLRLSQSNRTFWPKELRIRDYFRFEGTSDPGDMSVIYALEAFDGTRGYLMDAFGTYADPRVSAVVQRIPTEPSSERASSRRLWWSAIALIVALTALIGLGLKLSRPVGAGGRS
jgi:hypothetical protein